jgi:tetratricopeptide (TPR) repeat protein
MGCAHLAEERPEERREDALLKSALREAADLEAGDDWVEALKKYKIALTLNPQSREALEGRSRVEETLGRLAEEHYNSGRKLQEEGRFSEARKRFLAALRLRPDHPAALETLTSRKRLSVQEYVLHKLQPGESLFKLAAMYYGDPAKFSVIARFNQIEDARFVKVGQQIKIPLLPDPGAEPAGETRPEVKEKDIPTGYWDWSSIDAEEAERRMPAASAKAEETDQIVSYRELGAELFKEGRYREALFEFNKVLGAYPDDEVAIDYSYRASFELGLALFQMKDYLAAREQFLVSLKYGKDCRQCHAYVKECEELYKEMHYKRGIELYGREQLAEAIKAWEMVQGLDRNYKRVDYYIRKTKEIQGKLQELKQETQQSLSD